MYGAALTAFVILVVGHVLVRRAAASSRGTLPARTSSPQPASAEELSKEMGSLLGVPSLRGPVEKEVSALRVELVDYCALTASLGLFVLFDFENAFYTLATKISEEFQGELERFDGESITLVFGRLLQLDDHRQSAISAALALRYACESELAATLPEGTLAVRAAVTTGRAVAGPVGVDYRKAYTVFGPPITDLSTLLPQAAAGEIVLREDAGFPGLEAIEGLRRSDELVYIPRRLPESNDTTP